MDAITQYQSVLQSVNEATRKLEDEDVESALHLLQLAIDMFDESSNVKNSLIPVNKQMQACLIATMKIVGICDIESDEEYERIGAKKFGCGRKACRLCCQGIAELLDVVNDGAKKDVVERLSSILDGIIDVLQGIKKEATSL